MFYAPPIFILSSADNFCKQIGPRSGPTKCWAWSGSNLFDAQMYFLNLFRKSGLKKSADNKKHEKISEAQRVKV